MLYQNTVEKLSQENKRSENSKEIIIALAMTVLLLLIILVAVVCVVVISFFNYRCYDCRKSLVFEKHVSHYVCEECHDRWMAEEYGITK